MIGKEKAPLLSIIVPFYNVDLYIKECIESILNQSFDDFELILVNDGSTDESGKICETYKLIDHRIKVVHQNNGGISVAREVGFNLARGEYIGFVDSDDIIDEELFRKLLKMITHYDADIAGCDYSLFTEFEDLSHDDDTTNEEILLGNVDALRKMIINNSDTYPQIPVMLWGKIYKKNLLNKINFNDSKSMFPYYYFEDIFLSPLLLLEASNIVYTKEKLYYYRMRRGSLTRSSFNIKKAEVCKVYKYLTNTFKQNNMIDLYKVNLRGYGNSLIKIWMEASKDITMNDFCNDINIEFKSLFPKLIRDSESNMFYKLSYLIFKINPMLWKAIAGKYYFKKYNSTQLIINDKRFPI